ncbi:MAG: hypothetical protein AAFQ47_13370, partial [Pseudomonadota bacterium]
MHDGPVAAWDFSELGAPYVDHQNGHPLAVGAGATAPLRKPDGFRPGIASLAFDGTDQHLVIAENALGRLQMGGA